MDTVPVLPSYLNSILKALGAVIAGWLIAKGYFTAQQTAEIGGSVLTVIVVIYGLYSKYKANKALNAAIAAPAGQAK